MRYSSGLPVVDGVINNLTDEIERYVKYCSACAAAWHLPVCRRIIKTQTMKLI